MSKRVQISTDAGTTYVTFPGDKADLTYSASDIKDTIFGQNFESDQTGLINFAVTCNGIYKGFAGYVAKVLSSGSTTAFTGEATTLVSGKTYKITALTKSYWDRSVAVTVHDGATLLPSSDIASIDYLYGQVTLASGYSPVAAITVTGSYLPMTQIAGANSFTLTQSSAAIDETTYATAQANNGYHTYIMGLKTVKLSLKGIYSASNGFKALLQSRAEMIIEINPDGSELSVARGFFKPMTSAQSGNVGELEDMSLDFSLYVPDQASVTLPFEWQISSSSTLSASLQQAIADWQNGAISYINYLPDGTNGVSGQAVITDLSLTGGLDVMNEFSLKFQGSGNTASVGTGG